METNFSDSTGKTETDKMRAKSPEQLERWLREPETILADIQAAQGPKRKRTDPLPMWRVELLRESNRQRPIKKRLAARKAAEARYDAKVQAKRLSAGRDLAHKMLEAMQPGQWYGLGDVVRAAGITRGMRFSMLKALTSKLWIERAPNPAHDPTLGPIAHFAGKVEPKWLYKLTAAGEQARAQ